MADWPIMTVAELVEAGVLDRPMDGNHGEMHPKSADFVSKGIPFIMASNLVDGHVDLDHCAYISLQQAQSLRKGFAKAGDVLLSHKATIGRTAIIQPNDFPFLMLTPQVTYYRVRDASRLIPSYLRAYFDSREFQEVFGAWSGAGSTRAYLGITAQLKLPIRVPPIAVQKSIAEMITPLRSKIELNRKMNETLEAMAGALFRDWFVDFGPTRAKMEGRPAYLSEDLWSLFPDRLDEERKPEGWTYEPLLDQAEWVNGAAYKNMHFADGPDALPVIKIAELKNGVTGNTQRTSTDLGTRYLIDDGELLFSWSGNPDTSIDTFLWTGGKAWLNQHIFAVRENGKRSKRYLHALLKYLKPEFAELARNKQTTGLGHVTKADMQRMMVCAASSEVHQAFDRLIEPIFNQALGLQKESRTLAQTRDLLLPRLMSGELRVSQTEEGEKA